MNSIPVAYARIPDWQGYLEDYKTGLPVLASSSMKLPGKIYPQILDLSAEFERDPGMSKHVTAWLLDRQDVTLSHPGLIRYFGWTILAGYLRPLITAFENWRDEEAWLHPYCPICGSGPSMAQLLGTEPARRRMLVCGNCGTRWRFSRMGCPFCEETDDHRLSVLPVEGERQFRNDYCDSCYGYLKRMPEKGMTVFF